MRALSLAFFTLVTLAAQGQVRINEICPANADIIYDTTFYEFGGWVELYNPGASPVAIGGYYLTDDPAIPTKWQVPANTSIASNSYLLIWTDGNNRGFHTNFSLDTDGEYVALSNASGVVLDELHFPEQYLNVAYGRVNNGLSWEYLMKATPAADNSNSTGTLRLPEVQFSVEAGKFASEQTVTLSHPRNGVKIYYTVDGAEPNESSSRYENFPIVVSKTTTVKAKAFLAGFIPSKTVVKTYLVEPREFSIPIISISMNERYLSNDTIGIYVAGTNGIPGSGTDVPVNFNQNWYRHAHFEYFKPNGEKIFDQPLDVRIYGNYSRRKAQKSFAFKARDKYGKNGIEHKLFPLKDVKWFGGFVLRNSGTDWNISLFRDALMQRLTVGQLDLDYMDYQPTAVFLNGEYWGILNLREKSDEDYFKSNYGIAREDLDMLEGSSGIESGDRTQYNIYFDSLQKTNRAQPETMKFIERYVDVQNFINYQVHNIYIVNTDWPGNNLKFWRRRSENGKFRWMLWDNDFGFGGVPAEGNWDHLTLNYVTDPNSTLGHNKPWSTRHLRLLLENPAFKQRFISTLVTAVQTTYEPTRVLKELNQVAAQIDDEIPYHKTRWGGKPADWEAQVQRMRDFATLRNNFIRQHIVDFFSLDREVKLHVKSTPEIGGSYQLNGMKTSKQLDAGLFYHGLPFSATAHPNNGFKFKKWKIHKRSHSTSEAVALESVWKYFDKGILPAESWSSKDFNDQNWASGQAQLGYGEGDEKTKVSFGPSSSNKYVTTYFRKDVTIEDVDKIEDIQGSILYDDGAVVYINGVEVFRVNMPLGTITNTTVAADGIGEAGIAVFSFSKDLLSRGKNTIAVEVHQSTLTSSDVSFDLSLTLTEIGEFENLESTNPAIEGVAYSDVTLEAVFELASGVVINEFSTTNSTVEDEHGETDDWIELFNRGNSSVDVGGFYITDDLKAKTKYRIPIGSSSTILQPGDYLLLWADGQPGQGTTHLNFKLADEGESLGLYKADEDDFLTVDEVIFGFQMKDQSWSRVPNATGPFGRTSYITPREENTTILASEGEQRYNFIAYPNPTDDLLNLSFEKDQNEIVLYDMFGRIVQNFGVLPSNAELDLGKFSSGVYILKVRSGKKSGFLRIVKQ